MNQTLVPFLITTLSLICINTHAQLSKAEKKIVSMVDKHNAVSLKLLEEVVNINSGTMNFDGVFKVGQVFKTQLDALGFKTRWVGGESWGRAGHLIAEYKGNASAKTVLLIGHLDTVFELNSPFQQYKFINDSTASGPGVADMKGGDVVIVQSLRSLHDAGFLHKMNIIVFLSGDEELSGKPLSLARHDLIQAAKTADIALGFEDGDGKFETANIARRSSFSWELKVSGVPSHSSQIFTENVGAGAIYEACRIVNGFYDALSREENLTLNPGFMLGGTTVTHAPDGNGGNVFGKGNIVSKDAIVKGDLRAISPEQLVKAQQVMKEIVSKHLPQTQAEIVFDDGYPPLAPTPGNYELLRWFDAVSRDLNFGAVQPVNPRDAGAADISFTGGYVDMAMDGLGPRSSGGHTVQEVADPRTVSMQAKRTAVLLYRISRLK